MSGVDHGQLRRDLAAKLRTRGVDDALASGAPGVDDCTVLEVTAEGPGAPGTSRFGGAPDLPPGVAWPENDGLRLTFIAQLNLAEIPHRAAPLPSRGWLYFFIEQPEPAFNVETHVLFYDGDEAPQPMRAPKAYQLIDAPTATALRPVQIAFRAGLSMRPDALPGLGLQELHALEDEINGGTPRSQLLGAARRWAGDPCRDAYMVTSGFEDILYCTHKSDQDFEDDLQAARDNEAIDFARFEPATRRRQALLRGFRQTPEEVHQANAARWRLLLKVASHRDAGMDWWDSGFLQFFVEDEALHARRFGRVYASIATA